MQPCPYLEFSLLRPDLDLRGHRGGGPEEVACMSEA